MLDARGSWKQRTDDGRNNQLQVEMASERGKNQMERGGEGRERGDL